MFVPEVGWTIAASRPLNPGRRQLRAESGPLH